MTIATRFQVQAHAPFLTEAMRKRASALSKKSDLFLSHSSKDKGSLLNGAIEILADHGATVYADMLDPEARRLAPTGFGAFFSEAIAQTERLVALVTESTATSKWVPWELGLAHGLHSADRVAVWPVRELNASAAWARQEYFEMYPRIERVNLDDELQWAVRDPADGRFWTLSTWLTL